MFALEIELLTGLYRAALPDGSGAEWPPHPERVLSALVQAWGDGGCDARERAALEWFESLPAPLIEADDLDDCHERSSPTVFVPPNDVRGEQLAALPDRRPRQARGFKARLPVNPIVRLIWPETPGQSAHATALDALARRVASVGHSASLVRLTFSQQPSGDDLRLWRPGDNGANALRAMHPGRVRNLERWLASNERPRIGVSERYQRPSVVKSDLAKSVFGGVADWFVFEDAGGERPDILAFAHVAKCVRMSLMTHGRQPPPGIISGHTSEGNATSEPHVAIVPLANIAWPYATGDLLGFAVVLPRGVERAEREPVLQALAGFARISEGEAACADLRLSRNLLWRVQRSPAPSRASLQPNRWCGAAVRWASATPVFLDRFPDHNDAVEEARLIATACRNIGMPEPIEIEIHKHSALRSAPSAYANGGSGSTPDWSFPDGAKFAQRPRRHVVLRFAEPVEGPVLLGAGRFHGLGLCLPLIQETVAP